MEKVSNKEFHIFSVGNSLCSHYENSLVEKEKKDEEFWKHVYEDRNELKKILDFLRSDPETYSAEVQAFSCYKKANESKLSGTSSYELYFVITDTYSNRVVGKVLEIFFKEKGYKVDVPFKKDVFREDIPPGDVLFDLVQRLLEKINKKRNEGYRVLINATGGLKPYIWACSVISALTGVEMYYVFEKNKKVIVYPPLFFKPSKDELEILKTLSEVKKPLRPTNAELFNKVKDFLMGNHRLANFRLIEENIDSEGKLFDIRISSLGKLLLEYNEEE